MAGTTRSKLVEPLKGMVSVKHRALVPEGSLCLVVSKLRTHFCFGASGERLSSACASEHPVLDLRGSRVAPPPPPGGGHAQGPRPPPPGPGPERERERKRERERERERERGRGRGRGRGGERERE